MPLFWRLVLTIYNLLMILLGAVTLAATLNVFAPLPYLEMALSPENRLPVAAIAVLVIFVAAVLLIQCWRKVDGDDDGIIVQEGLLGQVTMTVAAIELLIMKSVKQIDGIKEVRPQISKDKSGLTVKLHMMINPELNIPEVTAATQKIVKEQLEQVGGLQVNAVKVRVDDFKAGK